MMKKSIIKIFTILIIATITSCNCAKDTSETTNDISTTFVNGDLMTNKVWAPDFTSAWHYHPYQCVAHIIQGELTVNFDTSTSLDDKSPNKSPNVIKTFKAGEVFIGTSNTWHYSQNLGTKDLIFTTSWLAEKDAPIVVLADKE
jgi:mannose-6-phosphate isomerase-like protein (cupin superfamily)